MAQYSKATRKKLRELAGESYERELGKHLDELLDKFHAWEKGEIVSSKLSHFIHKFHNGVSREIYNMYNYLQEDDLVARAVVLNLLTKDEVTKNILEQISSRTEFYKQRMETE